MLEGRKLMLKLNEGWQVNESRYARGLLASVSACVNVRVCVHVCMGEWVGVLI